MTTPARVRPLTASHRPPLPPMPLSRSELATDALVTLWACLEGMGDDDARAWLTGPGSAFLPGVDVGAVLDALQRDRIRREARR